MTTALAKVRKPGISRAMKGNLNSAKNPWRSFWRRRALRPEDRFVLSVVDRLAEFLINDKGGPQNMTAAEVVLVQNIQIARACAMLCMQAIGEEGGFRLNADGQREATPGMRELPRFLSAERQAIQALGTSRRAAPALNLNDYLKQRSQGQEPESIPASAQLVEENA